MLQLVRQMPPGVLLFLAYAFVVLSILGLTMPVVIDQAVQTPITFIGLVWMGLLAYLIFTMTLVLQRKQAAFGLSLGLTTLLLPLAAIVLLRRGRLDPLRRAAGRLRGAGVGPAPAAQPRVVLRAVTAVA